MSEFIFKRQQPLLTIGVIALSLFSTGAVLFDTSRPMCYSLLWLLPLGYLLSFSFLFLTNTVGGQLYHVIVVAVYFVRMVITPAIMMAGEYESVIPPNLIASNADIAILLMCLENFFVFVFLSYLSKKDISFFSEDLQNKPHYDRPSFKLFIGITALVVLMIVIIRMDSSITKAVFLNILDTDDTYYALSDTDSGVGTLSMFVELLSALFKVVQIILPPFLLFFIAKIRLRVIRMSLIMALLILVCLYATEDRIDAILAGFALLMTSRDSLDKVFKKTSIALIVLLILISVLGVSIKGHSEALISPEASSTFASYFSGVPTVAAGLDFVGREGTFRIYQVVPDFVSKIPFASYAIKLFLGISVFNSNQLFNQYLIGMMGYGTGQILPTTIVGCRYFGYPLYFIFPLLLILLARYYCKKIYFQNNIVIRNLYYWITISVALSPVVMSGLLIVGKLSWFYISLIFVKFLSR